MTIVKLTDGRFVVLETGVLMCVEEQEDVDEVDFIIPIPGETIRFTDGDAEIISAVLEFMTEGPRFLDYLDEDDLDELLEDY